MRLADFILANIEPILVEWEAFARTVWPGGEMDPIALRDHAKDILSATAWDMKSAQTALQQSDKSKGEGDGGAISTRVDGASDVHAVGRVRSGFDLLAVVAEYRALRASVIRQWRESAPNPDQSDLADITRFNESIDQSLTEAVRSYTRQVDQSRQMFLAILGHDLRNPLNSIMMSAQLLSSEDSDAESLEMTGQIIKSTKAMGKMITDLLDFTSTGLGSAIPISPAAMDLKQLCKEVVDEIRLANPKRSLRYVPNGELTGMWDAPRLRQVVSNLLGNAIQHGGRESAISLSVEGMAAAVRITVQNDGPPIPQEDLPTIFDPLVRGSAVVRQEQRPAGSIGLGLYIAREVVTAHGGTIEVQSTTETGTAFSIRLPRRC